MSLENQVVTLAAVFTAVATICIAVFTWRAADATKRATQAQLLLQLLNEYASEEMDAAAKKLALWSKSPKAQQDNVRSDEIENHINKARRRYSHYCQKVHMLRRDRLIDEPIVQSAVTKEQAELYLAIEPLERAKAIKESHDESSFRFFAELYGLPRNKTS